MFHIRVSSHAGRESVHPSGSTAAEALPHVSPSVSHSCLTSLDLTHDTPQVDTTTQTQLVSSLDLTHDTAQVDI